MNTQDLLLPECPLYFLALYAVVLYFILLSSIMGLSTITILYFLSRVIQASTTVAVASSIGSWDH